jgi:hypothetical protein
MVFLLPSPVIRKRGALKDLAVVPLFSRIISSDRRYVGAPLTGVPGKLSLLGGELGSRQAQRAAVRSVPGSLLLKLSG